MSEEEVSNLPTITVHVNVMYGLKRISDVEVILTNDDTNTSFTGTTNNNGECDIQISACESEEGILETYEDLLRDYLVEVGCEKYSTNTNVLTTSSKSNQLLLYLVKLDDCQNQILTNKNCKYFHHDPYMTPNNYDIYFDPASIPSNIIQDPPNELLLRLQKTMPLTDILHLNLEKEQNIYLNVVNLYSSAKLKFNIRDLFVQEFALQVMASWTGYEESENLCSKTYEIHYLYNNTIPIRDVVVKLINEEYPLIQYAQKTDENGICSFSELPYGRYIQQIFTSEYSLPQTLINVSKEEEVESILLGSTEEESSIDFYINGILSSNNLSDNHGEVIIDGDSEYDKGELRIDSSNEFSEEDDIGVLLHSNEVREEEDFTEFTVKIIDINQGTVGVTYKDGILESSLLQYEVGQLSYEEYIEYEDGYLIILTEGVLVDEVKLNESNNFSSKTKPLPLFEEGTNNKVFYQAVYNKKYCNVELENIDDVGLIAEEVVLF